MPVCIHYLSRNLCKNKETSDHGATQSVSLYLHLPVEGDFCNVSSNVPIIIIVHA